MPRSYTVGGERYKGLVTLIPNEWIPITDADLFVEDEAPAPAPVSSPTPLPVVSPPTPPLVPLPTPKRFPRRGEEIYTVEDWRIFDKWVHTKGFSIDQAAACAGIKVYDALTMLEQRDPYYYQIAVMIHPQCYASPMPRGHRGMHMGMGGEAKNYAREENKTPARASRSTKPGGKMVSLLQPDRRLSEDEARERFLAVLGIRNPRERVDGLQDTGFQWTAAPAQSKKRKLKLISKKKKKKKTKKITKCGACRQPGHNRSACPELAQEDSRPTGSITEACEW